MADHAGTIVALPTIADDLDTDLLTAQWVLVGYSVTIAALLLPMGKLGDIVGRKPVYVAGLIAFIVGSALAGSAPNVIGLILAGSFLIEKVFNIDGMGSLGYTSILQRDYPVALGILVISSLLMLVGNILSDMIYVVVDPRIRFK